MSAAEKIEKLSAIVAENIERGTQIEITVTNGVHTVKITDEKAVYDSVRDCVENIQRTERLRSAFQGSKHDAEEPNALSLV